MQITDGVEAGVPPPAIINGEEGETASDVAALIITDGKEAGKGEAASTAIVPAEAKAEEGGGEATSTAIAPAEEGVKKKKVRSDEERSEEPTTLAIGTKTIRARTSVQDAPPP